jgi:hypothetical protein
MSKIKELSEDWIPEGVHLTVEKKNQFYRNVFFISKDEKLIGTVFEKENSKKKLFAKKEWAFSPLRGQPVRGFRSFSEASENLFKNYEETFHKN